jgi:N-acetylglucosamine malate deacetylase 2
MPDACLIVAPHPDDETIGAGIWMARNRSRDITLVHLTDGSPRNLTFARAAGFHSRKAYAAARRRELKDALRLLAPNRIRLRRFDYPDQETCGHLPELIARLAALIDMRRPSLVLSPAYEGGHPDHDSASLAVAVARALTRTPFRHREYALYHAGPNGETVTGKFLPCGDASVEVCILSAAEQDQKRAMLASFASQQDILKQFPVFEESFRDAPDYRFSRPPHSGRLLYEHWNFEISGEEWRRRAREVLTESMAAGDPRGSLD